MPTPPSPDASLAQGLELVERGEMRVDGEAGMVLQKFRTTLYEYERPVGAKNTNGYVVLSFGKGNPQLYAHRLIWAVCTGELPLAPMVVNHKNGVKWDNRLDNLELVTQAENITHAYATGLAPSGERHFRARVSDADVRRIYALSFSESASSRDVADRFNIYDGLVRQIWTGHRFSKAVA